MFHLYNLNAINPIDWVIVGGIVAIVVGVIISLILAKKKGKNVGCGCGCSGCSSCPSAGKCGAQKGQTQENTVEEKEEGNV